MSEPSPYPGLDRRAAWLTLGVSWLLTVVLALWLVPWDWVPGGSLHPMSAQQLFTPAEIRRAEDFAGLRRALGWSSYGVSLLVALVLGTHPAGGAAGPPGEPRSQVVDRRGRRGARAARRRTARHPAVRAAAPSAKRRLRAHQPEPGRMVRGPGQGPRRLLGGHDHPGLGHRGRGTPEPAATGSPGPARRPWSSRWSVRRSTRWSWSPCSTSSRRCRTGRSAPPS